MINTEEFYTLPTFEDPEGSPVMVSYEFNPPNTFINIYDNKKRLKFAPTLNFQLGPTEIKITLKDQLNFNSTSTFTVTVYAPPKIRGTL
jgi:hypothetical protein